MHKRDELDLYVDRIFTLAWVGIIVGLVVTVAMLAAGTVIGGHFLSKIW